MNMLSTMTSTEALSNLELWALQCHEVPDEKWPRAILEVCQIVTDEALRGDDPDEHVARKRRVFERVAIGDTLGAIRAIIPQGFEIEMLGKRNGSFAIIRNLNGVDARSAGVNRDRALLGAVIQLAIRLRSSDQPLLFAQSGISAPILPGTDTSIAA